MLTEVTFCITCYLTVLAIEYAPVVMKNRRLSEVPSFLVLEKSLHKVMVVFAGVGTFLSFFHQGSLGGLYGVMNGHPFSYRDGVAIWPSTFFLFILSAAAVGPSFVLLTTRLVETLTRKTLVKQDVFRLLARISGWLLLAYVAAKSIDTLVWLNATAPRAGVSPASFYAHPPFGTWVLFAEVVPLGLVPALLLLWGAKKDARLLVPGAALASAGIVLNRFVQTIQTQALPTLPFDRFLSYSPSWQETAAFLAVVAYGVIVYSISYRYLVLFPEERELSRGGV